jgi:hypothetical protein
MRLYYRIKNFFVYGWDSLRARCQRFKRGYAYGDVWDMDFWFIRTVKPMLIHLRDYGIGIPGDLYLEGTENEREAWEAVLTEMINCLDMMGEDNVRKNLGLWYGRSLTLDEYNLIIDTMQENTNHFFELFSKYFYNLWD